MRERTRQQKGNRKYRRRKVTVSAELENLQVTGSLIREIKLNLNQGKLNPMFDNNLKN